MSAVISPRAFVAGEEIAVAAMSRHSARTFCLTLKTHPISRCTPKSARISGFRSRLDRAALAGRPFCSTFRQQRHRRQIRSSPDALRRAFLALSFAYLYSPRGRGIDHRSRLDGEAMIYEMGAELARPRVSRASRNSSSPTSILAASPRALRQELRRLRRYRAGRRNIAGRLLAGGAAGDLACCAPCRVFLSCQMTSAAGERCFEAFNIQAHGLQQRLRASKIEKLVIGVSAVSIQRTPCLSRDGDGRA